MSPQALGTFHGGTMGLWMLLLLLFLLLHFHLGNAPRIEGGGKCGGSNGLCVALPAPSNVSIYSFNMEHTLSFLPGPETPPGTHFTVQILRFRKSTWRPVTGCSELVVGQTCNLTRVFKDQFGTYQARVQAFTPNQNQTSEWTLSKRFQPQTDTVMGPPDVSVSGCGNCLLLYVTVPKTLGLEQYEQLQSLYRELHIHVHRTRDGVQFKMKLQYKEENMISYLQPGVEYCVTVTVTVLFNSKSVPSKPFCAFTSPPPRSSLKVVYCLLGAFSVLGFLLIGVVVYGGQLSNELLRRRLPRIVHRPSKPGPWECSAGALGADFTPPRYTAGPPLTASSESADWF
ncbi:interferon alpha/beta receptor 2-like [Scomber japonicus]|uniref:interferon alpha/beta receptor 2-like n=1 Tax=Scomber japonicus TaxID=13676 RepID=UPI002305F09D|nr:interferon alpha/beta receptor 2-like [Scomber japonicus]